MRVCGIVSEYNPFHNGHEYMISQLRKKGITHVVAVMSGNYVQRCEPAIMSKNARAEAAIRCGADLVIEIPSFWSTATAERFASAGIYLLYKLGCVTELGFGCENDDLKSFETIADILLNDTKYDDLMKEKLKEGVSYPLAREFAVREIGGEDLSHIMNKPNNILAIEYVKALKKMNIDLNINAVKRTSVQHDSTNNNDEFMSAYQIRKEFIADNFGLENFIPNESMKVIKREIELGFAPVDYCNLELAILAKLRTLSPEDFLRLSDVSEGLENRICNAIKSSVSLEELIEQIKTKRYTHSRIRRIIFDAFFDITKEEREMLPPYLKVLALNDKGKEILKMAKNKANLPIVMKSADINKLDEKSKYVFSRETKMTDVYSLIMPKPRKCGSEMSEEVFVL